MVYVLDCSFCAALFLPDEESEVIKKHFYNIDENDQVYVPLLWWYELSNVLTIAVRRNRLKHSNILNIGKLLSSFGFITDSNYGNSYMEKLIEFSHIYNLSSYDAAYLELAIRHQAVMGTTDKALKNSCLKAGVKIL